MMRPMMNSPHRLTLALIALVVLAVGAAVLMSGALG